MAVQAKSAIKSDISTDLADNGSNNITPAVLRNILDNIVDSYEDLFIQIDTATRDLLTPSLGMIIFNTDTARLNMFSGSIWSEIQQGAETTSKIYSIKVTIPSADILTSYDTPVEVISAPPVGKIIDMISVNKQIEYNTTPYDTNVDANLFFDSELVLKNDIDLGNTTSRIYKSLLDESWQSASTALTFKTKVGNPLNGDSDLIFYITYQLIDL